jgi:hypothetical protein
MKIMILICGLVIVGCKDSTIAPQEFSFEGAAGIWVPFELIHNDGAIQSGSFNANSFFGVYAESFKLSEDQTFIPVIWSSNTNFQLKEDETGTCTLSGNRLVFNGIWELDFELIKFESNELWLKRMNTLHKFRKELN